MNEKYALTFTPRVPSDVFRRKLLKIKESINIMNPSGEYTIYSCCMDSDVAKIKGFKTDTSDLLNEIFGEHYVSMVSEIISDTLLINGICSNTEAPQTVEELVDTSYHQIVKDARYKLYSNRDDIVKMFIITNGEIGPTVAKEVSILSPQIVII